MASKITPNILRITPNPLFPNKRSIFPDDFNTAYTTITLISIAIMILILEYTARKDKMVVIVPAPAIRGNAIGTIDAVLGLSSLYRRMPKIISKARKNNTNEPATANELASIPISFKISSLK